MLNRWTTQGSTFLGGEHRGHCRKERTDSRRGGVRIGGRSRCAGHGGWPGGHDRRCGSDERVRYLRDPFSGATTSFFCGHPGVFPIVGDWDCDGVDTRGCIDSPTAASTSAYSNTHGVADIKFCLGNPGDIPLAGDINGHRCTAVSICGPSEGRVYVINELGANGGDFGAAEFAYYFGDPARSRSSETSKWDGTEAIGLHRGSTGLM